MQTISIIVSSTSPDPCLLHLSFSPHYSKQHLGWESHLSGIHIKSLHTEFHQKYMLIRGHRDQGFSRRGLTRETEHLILEYGEKCWTITIGAGS